MVMFFQEIAVKKIHYADVKPLYLTFFTVG